jgi:hypothetical protein
MSDQSPGLESAVTELDDNYLKVLLLMSSRRAQNEEPRRAGFWHAIAVTLAAELETRQDAAVLQHVAVPLAAPADPAAIQAVLEELRRDLRALEAEYREAAGELPTAGDG